jgi:hypothetical protein
LISQDMTGRDTILERFMGSTAAAWRFSRVDAAIIFAAFLPLLLAYFGPLLQPGSVLASGTGDIAVEWWWKRAYLGQSLARGHLPQWNPFSMSGSPFLATVVTGVFYPLNWLFAILPTAAVLNGQIIFHFWLGLLAMYILARRLGRTVPASFIAAIMFAFTGHAILRWWAGHLQATCEGPYLPLVLLAQIGILAGRTSPAKLRSTLCLAALLALQLFAGHPQYVYYTLIVVGFLQAGFVFSSQRQHTLKSALVSSAWVLAACVFAGLLVAVQVLPAMRLAGETVRSGAAPMAYYEAHSQPISDVITAFAPWAFGGKPGGQSYFGSESYWEVSAPLTAAGCILLLANFCFIRRWSSMNWALAALLVFSCILAWGSNTPAYGLTFHLIPGFSLFRNPGRLLLLVTFAAGLLSSDSLDRLIQCARDTPLRFRRIVMGLLGIIAIAAVAVVLLVGSSSSPAFQKLMRARVPEWPDDLFTRGFYDALYATFLSAMASAALWAALTILALLSMASARARRTSSYALCLIVLAEALAFAWPFRTSYRPADLRFPEPLIDTLSKNNQYRVATAALPTDYCQTMAHGVRNSWGYDTATTTRYGKALLASQHSEKKIPPMLLPLVHISALTRSLATKYLLTRDGYSPPDPQWQHLASFGRYALWQEPAAVPRARLVAHARSVSSDLITSAVNDRRHVPAIEVLLEGEISSPITDEATSITSPGELQIVADEPEHFAARTITANPSWLVLMDQMLPGWTATVDGNNVRIYRADAIGRAVHLPPGQHEVVMRYVTPGLVPGAWISCPAWALWFALFAYVAIGWRRDRVDSG